jgi:hypothetical protein
VFMPASYRISLNGNRGYLHRLIDRILLAHLGRLLPPYSGSILHNGTHLTDAPDSCRNSRGQGGGERSEHDLDGANTMGGGVTRANTSHPTCVFMDVVSVDPIRYHLGKG